MRRVDHNSQSKSPEKLKAAIPNSKKSSNYISTFNTIRDMKSLRIWRFEQLGMNSEFLKFKARKELKLGVFRQEIHSEGEPKARTFRTMLLNET